MSKILKKFTKEFFESDKRGIKKDLQKFVNKKRFAHRAELDDIIDSLYKFFVVSLAGGDENRARAMLESKNLEVRKADAMVLSFLVGITAVFAGFGIFFTIMPPVTKTWHQVY